MKSAKNLLSLILCCALIIFSCQQDDTPSQNNNDDPQENIPDTFSEYFGNEISRDFLGNVIDNNNNPIEGVTISIGDDIATTDSNGVFIINEANVNERFGYIKAEKAGYIHASRSVVPSNGTNKVTIMMLEETVAGSVNSGSSSTITTDDGSSVSFDGNFIKEDGTTYSGSVDVIVHHLDPTDDDMELQMPGMLYAQNEDGAERMLQTYGMLAVELRGSGGEDLNLAEGSTSEIQIPVDDSLLGIVPATIPLWYFDEVTGYWKEEGLATLQGNMYVGTVTHFSFWNCDIPAEAITLCVNATDENNNPLNNLLVTITSGTFGTTSGYINDNGEVCGYVPSNESLILEVFGYDICGDVSLLNQNIGPFNEDSAITIVVPDNTDIIQETVTGTFNTCSGDAVTEGYVQVTYGNQTFIDEVSNGAFEINLLRCSNDTMFSVKGSDYSNFQTTNDINFTFTTPATNVGTISACNSISEYIQYTIDGVETVTLFDYISTWITGLDDPILNELPVLNIFAEPGTANGDDCLFLYAVLEESNLEGTYDNWDSSIANDTGIDISFCQEPEPCFEGEINIIFNVTQIGGIGEYIDINFNGSFDDCENVPHTINGVIHVLRDQ
ncbi:MAG: hypothetical protein HRU50_12910 [Winogradskyella sp.]|uniref:hypothetical protein n=1 Tax=Winogradskyella sp. TaxID=1883156 RepID=UPI0025FFB0F0|nr:hypothetical protein [Winogradskyella sp.]NRB60824.1 hypothetical protein [Winogradskyella sp.]